MEFRPRIAELEAELAEVRQQQRRELVVTIAIVVGQGVVFSARELWGHRRASVALAAAFRDAGIDSPRQLGKKLRQVCGCGLTRIGEDRDGVLWVVDL